MNWMRHWLLPLSVVFLGIGGLMSVSAEERVERDPILGKWGNDKYGFEFFQGGRLLLHTGGPVSQMNWSRMPDGNLKIELDSCPGGIKQDIFSEKIEGDSLKLTYVKSVFHHRRMDHAFELKRDHPGPRCPEPEKAAYDSTWSYIGSIGRQLEKYKEANGRYPTTEQGLQALAVKPVVAPEPADWSQLLFPHSDIDPWGNRFQYRCPPEHGKVWGYDLWSLGPDGKSGTKDDIKQWAAERFEEWNQ